MEQFTGVTCSRVVPHTLHHLASRKFFPILFYFRTIGTLFENPLRQLLKPCIIGRDLPLIAFAGLMQRRSNNYIPAVTAYISQWRNFPSTVFNWNAWMFV